MLIFDDYWLGKRIVFIILNKFIIRKNCELLELATIKLIEDSKLVNFFVIIIIL